MANLNQLFQLSRTSDLLTFEATVDTGFEALAAKECINKFGPDTNVCYERGRIYVNVPISQYNLVKSLRSINNLHLVAGVLRDIDFEPAVEQNKKDLATSGKVPDDKLHLVTGLLKDIFAKEQNVEKDLATIGKLFDDNLHLVAGVPKDNDLKPAVDQNMEKDLATIGKLPDDINWKKYFESWKHISNFNGNLYPTREQYLEAVSKLPQTNTNFNEEIPSKINEEKENSITTNDVLRYRVTCYRSGKHTFGSQDAARSFGGRLQDMFQWIVKLDDYHMEIILDIKDRDAVVLITLTESSLHRRNITHFGHTTLRSTVSYNLLHLAEPKVGELIIDPFCGSGSIPMESAIGFPGTYHICGDIEEKTVRRLTASNISAYNFEHNCNLLIDPLQWDVCALPLRNSSIDIVTTDLPFGRRVGSKFLNKTLYVDGLREIARVVKPTTGRVVLLTADRRAYNLCLQHNKKYWKQMKMLAIKLGGLKAFVYLLLRTSCDFE